MYHCILEASKRSLMVGKCAGLLDGLDKLYWCQNPHLYSRLILISHKEVLRINCSESDQIQIQCCLTYKLGCPAASHEHILLWLRWPVFVLLINSVWKFNITSLFYLMIIYFIHLKTVLNNQLLEVELYVAIFYVKAQMTCQ